jgi:hypothetical protein|tara:strand:- start:2584 stop:2769 length:186 start_codon:yes stop_codon:yes gene_type:complete
MKNPTELLDTKSVREHFKISKTTLDKWTRIDRVLPYVKIGRRKFIKVIDINNLIEQNYITE